MSNEPVITIIGNTVADPELRYTPSGAAVCNFTVAQTPRRFNKQTNAYEDGETLFMRCNVWREVAENVTETLQRGMRVMVTGRLVTRSWEDKESGQKRSVMELQVDEVGPSLRYATAQVRKTERQGHGQQQAPQGGGWGQQGGDPWSTGQQAQQAPQGGQQAPQGGAWGGGQQNYDEPPW